MATVEEARAGVKLKFEELNPLFVARVVEATEKLKAGAFSDSVNLSSHHDYSKRMKAQEDVTLNQAVWYIESLGFMANISINKTVTVEVPPI